MNYNLNCLLRTFVENNLDLIENKDRREVLRLIREKLKIDISNSVLDQVLNYCNAQRKLLILK